MATTDRGGWLLGVDIGTTGVRGSVVDALGRVVTEAHEACPPDTCGEGRVEADAEAWWNAARAVIGRIGQSAPLARVEGVGG